MHTLTVDEPLNFTVDDPSTTACRVVVFYGDEAAKARAERLCANLGITLAAQIDLQFSWWVFPVLRYPSLARLAKADAISADIIIFSLGESRQLPAELQGFNEYWTDKRQGDRGLLAYLLEESPDESQSLRLLQSLDGYFRASAQRSKMDFLAPEFVTRLLAEAPCTNLVDARPDLTTHYAYEQIP